MTVHHTFLSGRAGAVAAPVWHTREGGPAALLAVPGEGLHLQAGAAGSRAEGGVPEADCETLGKLYSRASPHIYTSLLS